MTIIQLIQRAREDADTYNLQGITQAIPVEDWINGADLASGERFGALGLGTILHQTIYEYAFAARLLVHIEERQALTDPRAKTLGDLVTPKQIWYARSLARENGLAADAICEDLFHCPIEEISKKAASALIDHLKLKAAELSERENPADGRDDWAESAENAPADVAF